MWSKVFDNAIADIAALDEIPYCECLHAIDELDLACKEKCTCSTNQWRIVFMML